MKKVLPLISLLCYVVAVAGCIAHIICTVIPSTMMAIVFVAFVAITLFMMALSTGVAIGSARSEKAGANSGFEGLKVEEAEDINNASEESAAEADSVAAVFAAPDEKEEEQEKIEETVEILPEPEPETELDVLPDNESEAEGSNEESIETEEEPAIVVLPMTDNMMDDGEPDEPDEPDDDEDEDEDDDSSTDMTIAADIDAYDPMAARFKRSRYKFSYTSKLIQADDETKGYYSVVKNAFMSYKKVTATVSREHERIRRGRATIGIIKLRGKTVLLYLALDPTQFENTMYVGTDVSDISKYTDVPFLYRVKGPRKANRAVRLIGMVAEKFGLEATAAPANEDYVALYPYETTEALIEKGLVIDKVAEAARKAEEARLAAEEAAKVAEKAIDDAIKAQETAEQAAFKAAERAEEPHEEVEFKPAETENEADSTNA